MNESENLIQQLKQGDEKTIRDLYMKNKNGFLLFAARYKLPHDDLIDIYQDAIMALIENAKRGKIDSLKSNISTYLFGIGKFMIFQKLKKEKKTYDLADFGNLEYEDESYDESVYNLQINALEKAFNKLGEKCQQVLKLFYYEQKSMDEIQQELKYSNKDVLKSQKSRCLKQLKDLTQEKVN